MPEQTIKTFIEKGVIAPEELYTLMQSPAHSRNLRLLDGTFVLPGSESAPASAYKRAHIAGAQFFDIEGISDKDSDLPHMLPSAAEFATAAGEMGIGDQDFIVVYGQSGLVMGPARVWWMFRAFGHTRICVLDGGLPAWIRAGYATTDAVHCPPPLPAKFTPKPDAALLSTKAQVQRASETHSACILDARPAPRFHGETPEPRPGTRSGHIEDSKNVPASDLVDGETGILKPTPALRELLSPYSNASTIIATCGSGITACVIALALFNCGTKNVSIYDGSWAEWGKDKENSYKKTIISN